MCYTDFTESQSTLGGLPSIFTEGLNPPTKEEGGEANDYISWFDSVLYIHCSPGGIVLHNLPGKKIAANYHE